MATETTFRGEHYLKVDSKGRVMLPSPFRTVFDLADHPPSGSGFQMLLVYGGANRAYVEGFTQAGAADLDRRIAQIPMGTDEYDLANAIFVEQSITVDTDKDGRFSPPPQVREKLGLPKEEVELAFIGSRHSFRIWRGDVYRAKRKAEIEALEAKILDGADALSLFKATI
ncbi:MAG: division/cell wall cluster transcriptional repressor MraZ [Cypionkella sp.]